MSNKYGAERAESYDGRSFHSKGERDCYQMLKLLVQAGEYRDLECQVSTELLPGLKHRTDFKVWDLKREEPLWIEYKGMNDQRWRDIKKIWAVHGPGRLKVYTGYGLRMRLIDEIVPRGIPK